MEIEINKYSKPEVNWTKNPQVVVNEANNEIVLVHKNQSQSYNQHCFVGTLLNAEVGSDLEEYSDSWSKSSYTTFEGSITLKNNYGK